MNKINYYGANQTRNSVCKNPSAYTHDKSGMFGVKEFRKTGWVSDDTKDRVAEQQISQGWSKTKNKICDVCHVMKSRSGSCNC